MEQIYNPYLPLTEHIPDGEPHVFGDRLYIYGSHDRAGGTSYCEDHYTVWSAPVEDLRDWRCEGTAYLRSQDPSNEDDKLKLWAPDVAQGPDGRYYLYYCFSFYPEIGVAVSDSPAGPFSFYGHVHYPDSMENGRVLRDFMPFDPAVLADDDGRIFLYYGFAPACEKEMRPPEITDETIAAAPEHMKKSLRAMRDITFGENAMVAELEPDMLTLKESPRVLIPGGHHSKGTGFEGHAFFEASSIRKIRGRYYFVYSSHKSHELCYAVSDRPDGGFTYGGTIISNGDVGLNGRTRPVYPLGNNHGGIVEIGDSFYIFYHRQTNGTEFSRQGCAEKIDIAEDGSISQVEITSCGLNGAPLAGNGSYPAAIACHLAERSIPETIDYTDPAMKERPRVTESQGHVFISGIKNRTRVGYKYFTFTDADLLTMEIRGTFAGTVTISHDEAGHDIIGTLEVELKSQEWAVELIPIAPHAGKQALYFSFKGRGEMDFKRFGFISA